MIWGLAAYLQRTVPRGQKSSLLYQWHLDGNLVLQLMILSILSLFIIYSSSGEDLKFIAGQSGRIVIGFVVMFLMAQIPIYQYKFWAPWLFMIGIVLLLLVLLFGEKGGGAARWLNLGLFRFQPSEIMKLAVPMLVAWYISSRSLPPRFLQVIITLIIIAIPTALIAKQPDLGTAFLVATSGLIVLFVAGLRWRVIIPAIAIMSASAPLLWSSMHNYQKQRVLTFLNPEQDPLGTGYHIIQSKIAIGSGGLFGKGWLGGTQSRLDFLPERSTDFVFAVISEEFGLFGVVGLLMLYLLIVTRGLMISIQAQDTFSQLLAGALTLTFMVYLVVNIGMVTGLLPVVGVPLPLISYGGTSMVTLMAGFGILMSIHTRRRILA